MSFKSYAQTLQPDGQWLLTDPQPLVFSGRHGLIARFVGRETQRASDTWTLAPDELHAMALPGALARNRVIVFEQADGGRLDLLWLRSVRGVSASKTEMMFSFTPLTAGQAQPALHVYPPNAACSYGEELTLDGGVGNPTGSWHWKKPHLALGSVRLGPAK